MATGKSTVGRRLARKLGMRFLDIDSRIEARAGKPIARIFAEDGEPAFRDLERQAAGELSVPSGLVIATGGGIVLNQENLRDLARGGVVVCLSATLDTIMRRTAGDTTRPLLQHPDRRARVEHLLQQRAALYAAIPNQIATDNLTPDAIVERIAALYAAESRA